MTLHNQIMNIPCKPPEESRKIAAGDVDLAIKIGHRDARHSAAELARASDAKIEYLTSSLERITSAFQSLLASKPVRDADKILLEAQRALGLVPHG